MKKINYKNKKGITIIALTITIIVLLILAGVSISMLVGDNKVLNKSEESKKETEIMQYQDKLEVLKQFEHMNNYTDNIEGFLNNYIQVVEKDAMFNSNKGIIPDVENGIVTVITKEGYKFEVSFDDVIYVGDENDSDSDININDVRITIVTNPTDWTNQKVKVKILANTNKLIKQYSIDGGTNWKKYEQDIEIQDNGVVIQARAINNNNEITKIITKKIDNIDRLAPNSFTIKTTNTSNSITVEGTTTDKEATTKDGKSDIRGYKFSKDNGASWTDIKTEGKYTFEDLKLGSTYHIKVKAIDNAGNEIETSTKDVTVKEQEYTLTVNPNGGTWNNTKENTIIKQDGGTTKEIANPIPPDGHAITFNGNGGSNPATQIQKKTFTKWTKGGAGFLSGTTYKFGIGNGVLTANYIDNSMTLPSSTREGYTFEGWYDAANGGNKIGNAGEEYTPTEAKTLYAHWTVKKITVTFIRNTSATDNTSTTQTFTYGVTGQKFSNKGWSKTNYELIGWNINRSATTAQYSTLSGVSDSWIEQKAPSITIYAIWRPSPSVTITTQPSNQTVVSGNGFLFNVEASGRGTISYQWYYSATSNSASDWKPASTIQQYKGTSNMGLDGRYIYCKVTATVGESSVSTNSSVVRLNVQAANYSTEKSGKITYYNTLGQAFNGATSGGGDTGGGTITVLNSNTDPSNAINSKDIKINMNGKTITRSKYIGTNAGTLTIAGEGKINNNNTDGGYAILGKGGNLTISDNVRVDSEQHAITMTTGNLNINSGYFYGKGGDVIIYGGNEHKGGTVTIKNAHIYAPKKNTSAVILKEGNYAVTITDSLLGNGASSVASALNSYKSASGTLIISTKGEVKINGKTAVYAGPYGGSAIGVKAATTVRFLGNSCVYASNFGDSETANGRYCVNVWTSGSTIEFNSKGRFFASGKNVAHAENESKIIYQITKGDFAAEDSKYMFHSGSTDWKEYLGDSASKNYYWMDSLTTKDVKKSVSCYYCRVGSW